MSIFEDKVKRIGELESKLDEFAPTPDDLKGGADYLFKIVHEYAEIRREIRLALADSRNSLVTIDDDTVRATVRSIVSDEKLPLDNITDAFMDVFKFSEDEKAEYLGKTIDVDPFGDEAMDLFYSWFCAADYVRDMHDIGCLVLDSGRVPSFLAQYVGDARECYAFQQYLAVFCLSRAMLEICIYEMNRVQYEREHGVTIPEQEARSETKRMKTVERVLGGPKSPIVKKVRKLLREMDSVAHGNLFSHEVTQTSARSIFQSTLNVIYEMYRGIDR